MVLEGIKRQTYSLNQKGLVSVSVVPFYQCRTGEETLEIAFEINLEGFKKMALAFKKRKIVLIHVSMDYVFDGEKTERHTLGDIPNPISEYGKSKLKGEPYLQNILSEYIIV